MPTPIWADFFKTFDFAFTKDPLARTISTKDMVGAGIAQPDSIPSLSPDGSFWSNSDNRLIRLRETNDFIDLSTVSNRQSRYKEYERLQSIPEIEMALNVFSDESCLSGKTLVATPFGMIPIEKLAKEQKDDKFLVYCYDFNKKDYSLGWAHSPRQTKVAKTQLLILDDGVDLETTPDHKILMRDGTWKMAGDIVSGDELMPFYRNTPNPYRSKLPTKQYPRIFTFEKGWIHERQFVDDWRIGKTPEKIANVNFLCKLIAQGLNMDQILKLAKCDWKTVKNRIKTEGFTIDELRWMGRKKDRRRVLAKLEGKEQPVYDLTVEEHHNFCTDCAVVHNCQKDEKGHVLNINCKNEDVREELEFLFFHKSMINIGRRAWSDFKSMLIYGDLFYEIIIDMDNPKNGIMRLSRLPPESIYRIETTKGKIVEFQQSKEGPDYQSLTRAPVPQATEQDIMMATAIRFSPEQIVHAKVGDDRKTFYPYGVSMVESARGPAHQLRLMEDAMLVYRLCLDKSTRIRTNNGYKYISDIKNGDKVFSYSHGNLFENTVTNTMRHQPKEIWEAKSNHFSIKGTPDHRILVMRDGFEQYVEIKDLKIKSDQFISALHESNIPKKIEFGELWAKLSMQQRVLFRQKKYNNINEKLRKFDNPELVKQFLCTEGKSLPLTKAKEIAIEFNLNSESLITFNKRQINSERFNLPEEVTPEFARLFGFMYGNKNSINLTAKTDKQTNEFYHNLLVKFFGKQADSTLITETLESLGYSKTHRDIKAPEWLFNASQEIRKEFVLGLCEAEGTIRHTNKGTWFCTLELCNKNLIEDVKELWQSIGLSSGKLTPKKTAGYFLALTQVIQKKYENITSIAKIGEDFVYDISVDGDVQNFIANGMPVHNSRSPERRVFYIDVGQLPPFKAEAFVEKLKDQFRKKKVSTNRPGMTGPNSVEERYHAPAVDEDYWLPIRPNSNTKIETLPGAQNLGEIDDAVYFRNRLFTAMQFPKNYFNVEDSAVTRITLSAQDIRVARLIERLQAPMEDAMWEIANRHLKLRGFPEDSYEDLMIKMTPPSEWRELSRAEIVNARITNASSLKSAAIMSDFDILTRWMGYSEEESKIIVARNKMQKIEDAKMQILAQNPALLGVGIPSENKDDKEQEIGTTPDGPNEMLAPPGETPTEPAENAPTPDAGNGSSPLEEPSDEDILRYDMSIQNYANEEDLEQPDYEDYE